MEHFCFGEVFENKINQVQKQQKQKNLYDKITNYKHTNYILTYIPTNIKTF